MPFTLVHPAAVLPLARAPLSPSALVFGAMAPDVPYYVSLTWIGGDYNLTLTHTWSSLLWLDPALGLVLLAVFQVLLRRPLVALLPSAAAARLPERSALRPGWIALSLVLGAATHLAWDALDDAFGYGWSTRLNLVSDVAGFVVLIGWGVWWWRSAPVGAVPAGSLLAPRPRALVIGALAAVTVLWGVFGAVRVVPVVNRDLREQGDWSWGAVADYAVREFAIHAGTALAVAVVVYAVVHLVVRRLTR